MKINTYEMDARSEFGRLLGKVDEGVDADTVKALMVQAGVLVQFGKFGAIETMLADDRIHSVAVGLEKAYADRVAEALQDVKTATGEELATAILHGQALLAYFIGSLHTGYVPSLGSYEQYYFLYDAIEHTQLDAEAHEVVGAVERRRPDTTVKLPRGRHPSLSSEAEELAALIDQAVARGEENDA